MVEHSNETSQSSVSGTMLDLSVGPRVVEVEATIVPLDPLVCFENTMSSLVGDGKVALSDLKVMMLGYTLSDRSEVLKSPRGDPSLDLIKVDLAIENLME